MAQAYVTAIFPDDASARSAEARVRGLPGVRIARAYRIRRDGDGFAVEGDPAPSFADAQRPRSAFMTIFQRLWSGTSSEEDAEAIDDAEVQLRGTQTALVCLVTDGVDAVETALAAAGGTARRASPETLDAEDTRRFLDASSL